MRRKILHALIGVSMVATVLAVPQTTVGAAADGWAGFTATKVDTNVVLGPPQFEPPAWGAAVTEDLGGPGTDIWTNNHANRPEAHLDLSGTTFGGSYLGPTGIDTHGIAFADLDGDGDDDAIEIAARDGDNRVFRNDNGTMSEIQTTTGLEDFLGRGRVPLVFDFNGDGALDVLVNNLDRVPIDAMVATSDIYLSDGEGTFTWTKLADGANALTDGDLIMSHLTSMGPGTDNVVVTSNNFSIGVDTIGTGTGTIAEAARVVKPRTGPGKNATHIRDIVLGDLNGDLKPEVVVARQDNNLETDDVGMPDPAPATAHEEVGDGTPDLLGALPIGFGPLELAQADKFDIGTAAPFAAVSGDLLADNCRSVALADFDNDGDLDIWGGCTFDDNSQSRNIVALNDGAANFTIASSALVPSSTTATAVVSVVGDFNGDGWIDVFVGGGFDEIATNPTEGGDDYLFLNQGGNAANYLLIDLEGDNADAIGARVYVGSDKWQVRETAHRTHQGQDSGVLHFGLADQTVISQVLVEWPGGTNEACWVDGGVSQRVTIEKGSANCETISDSEVSSRLAATPDLSPKPDDPILLCDGRTVTVEISKGQMPTGGADVILGTEGADVINGLGGNDSICGLGGNDTIRGGNGNDRIFGDGGADNLFGDDGRDVIQGGAGNDTIEGGLRDDRLSGNGGNDLIFGGNGRDIINGHNGADKLVGQGGADRLFGGNGRDIIQGNIGNDYIEGGDKADRISGNGGADELRGGKGGDRIAGHTGPDRIFGEGGNDRLLGGGGFDIVNGNIGTDGCIQAEVRISCETNNVG